MLSCGVWVSVHFLPIGFEPHYVTVLLINIFYFVVLKQKKPVFKEKKTLVLKQDYISDSRYHIKLVVYACELRTTHESREIEGVGSFMSSTCCFLIASLRS